MARPKFTYPEGCTLEDSYALYPESGVTMYRYREHRRHFGFATINTVRLKDYMDRGWFHLNSHGRIDPKTADEAIARNLDVSRRRNDSCQPVDAAIPPYNDSRDRREHALAQKAELDLEEQRGTLVNRAEYAATLFTLLRDMRNAFQNIPTRVADTIAGMDDPRDIEETIAQEVDDALTDFADRCQDLTPEPMEVAEEG